MSVRPLIVLAAHGAGDSSPANRRVRGLADTLARRRRDLNVVAAFNLGTPGFSEVLDLHPAPRVVVLPLMTSDGYFAGTMLRGRLALNAAASSVGILHLPPVGTRSPAADLITRRVAEAIDTHAIDPSRLHIVVIGHGTRRSASSGATTDALAASLQALHPNADVRSVFLDQDPLLEDVAPRLARPHTIAVPFLIGGGGHALEDVPERLGAADKSDPRSLIILPALGDDPDFADLLAATIDSAVPPPQLVVGTRGSRLAHWQTDQAAAALSAAGAIIRRVDIATVGDDDRRTPLDAFPTDGPFSDALEAALLDGRIDVAVHSLKDLPLETAPGTRIAAVLRRWSPLEALVSRAGATLAALPEGAVVGTCSQRRTAQLLRLRPDLRVVPIRGTVEERVRQVTDGPLDATVLALAGLARLGLEDHAAEVFSIDRLVPEAGQGAIAIQTRDDDPVLAELCAAIDHHRTRSAIIAEREFARLLQDADGLIPAAHATARGVVRLEGRAISADGRVCIDVSEQGADPLLVARAAAERVHAALNARTEVAAS